MRQASEIILWTGYKLVGQRRLTDLEKAKIRREAFIQLAISVGLWISVPVWFFAMLLGMAITCQISELFAIPGALLISVSTAVLVLWARSRFRRGLGLLKDGNTGEVRIYEFVPVVPLDPTIWNGATKITLELLIESERMWSVNGEYAKYGWSLDS